MLPSLTSKTLSPSSTHGSRPALVRARRLHWSVQQCETAVDHVTGAEARDRPSFAPAATNTR
jgi:hypothetical protein